MRRYDNNRKRGSSMIKNYDACNFKMAIPEVTLGGGSCKVKLTTIGKMGQEECQLAILSCKLVTLKQQSYEIELQPDMLRLNSIGRTVSEGQLENPGAGFGLAGAKLEVAVLDLLKKAKYTIYFKRGGDRKWSLEGIAVEEQVEVDRRALREKRRRINKLL